jgi:hypothetical protein
MPITGVPGRCRGHQLKLTGSMPLPQVGGRRRDRAEVINEQVGPSYLIKNTSVRPDTSRSRSSSACGWATSSTSGSRPRGR